jgi:hypothetical protein
MKGILAGVMLLTAIQLFATEKDTTVTSFEIHLKRKSTDESIGFNTTSIDRHKLYNAVINNIKDKISAEAFCSLHEPLVLLKYNEYSNEKGHPDEISFGEERSLKEHKYTYFVKIYGQLNKSTFVMKVCVFDAQGRLVAKGKSKAYGKGLSELTSDGSTGISEQDFLDLVSDASSNLEISI